VNKVCFVQSAQITQEPRRSSCMNKDWFALIKRPEVKSLTGMSPAFMYALVKKGLFPAPVKNGRSSYWVYGEIIEWIENRRKERDSSS
jgi:predicted DNA-binding transcriptional regulator AlpA